MLIPNKNIKLILNYVAGPLVFCILVFSIYKQIRQQADWPHSLDHIVQALGNESSLLLLVVFLFMFVNWGIEARKWQIALNNSSSISFITSLKAIFSGTTMAFFTPNRIGEYMGRILYIEEGKRISSIAITITCSIAQLLVTIIAGIAGFLFISGRIEQTITGQNVIFWINLLIIVLAGVALVLTLFYFRLPWLIRRVEKIPGSERWMQYLRALDGFNATILLRILSLSFTRYIVFIVQYYLLFRVFGVDINWWQTFWSVSVVFLVIAIIPSIAMLTELGVRWGASIEVLHLFSSNTAGILAASLAVWLINLVIPALVGSLLIFGLKFFRHT